jgi:alpha-glucosidase
VSVEAQDGVKGSTLELYRKLMELRKKLQTTENHSWINHLFQPGVLHFMRNNGWHSLTNFGDKPVKLPKGELMATSGPLVNGKLPANATAWVKAEVANIDVRDMLILTAQGS